jgi:hypothetical protein
MNKPLVVAIITTLLFTLTMPQIFAYETREMKEVKEQQQHLTTRLENLKTRVQAEITRRTTSLTNLSNHISENKRLTDAQKTTFTSNMQTEITNLNALQTKITEETDAATLRTDVKSIVSSYRIYALYMPQVQIVLASNSILDSVDKFNALGVKLQNRISDAQSAEKDVSTLKTTYADFQGKVTDAQAQANDAISTVTSLQPQDYPGNKTTLQSARKMLQTARLDLKTARQDAQTIIQGLRALEQTDSSTSEGTDSAR